MRPRRIPGLPDCPDCNATVEELVHIAPGIAAAKPCGCVFAPGEFFPDDILEADHQRELVTDGGNQCTECGVTTSGAFLVEVDSELLCEDCAGERECVRCGRPTEETTLSGDPKCRPCQTRKRQQSTSREAGQGSLDEFVTDGGVTVVDRPTLGPCDVCERIRRCRPVGDGRYACDECRPTEDQR